MMTVTDLTNKSTIIGLGIELTKSANHDTLAGLKIALDFEGCGPIIYFLYCLLHHQLRLSNLYQVSSTDY